MWPHRPYARRAVSCRTVASWRQWTGDWLGLPVSSIKLATSSCARRFEPRGSEPQSSVSLARLRCYGMLFFQVFGRPSKAWLCFQMRTGCGFDPVSSSCHNGCNSALVWQAQAVQWCQPQCVNRLRARSTASTFRVLMSSMSAAAVPLCTYAALGPAFFCSCCRLFACTQECGALVSPADLRDLQHRPSTLSCLSEWSLPRCLVVVDLSAVKSISCLVSQALAIVHQLNSQCL